MKAEDKIVLIGVTPIDIEEVAHPAGPLFIDGRDIARGAFSIQTRVPLHDRENAIFERRHEADLEDMADPWQQLMAGMPMIDKIPMFGILTHRRLDKG